MIFNRAYPRALHSVSHDFSVANVTLKLKEGWLHERASAVSTTISEATNVDDQVYFLESCHPNALDKCIQTARQSSVKLVGRNQLEDERD